MGNGESNKIRSIHDKVVARHSSSWFAKLVNITPRTWADGGCSYNIRYLIRFANQVITRALGDQHLADAPQFLHPGLQALRWVRRRRRARLAHQTAWQEAWRWTGRGKRLVSPMAFGRWEVVQFLSFVLLLKVIYGFLVLIRFYPRGMRIPSVVSGLFRCRLKVGL